MKSFFQIETKNVYIVNSYMARKIFLDPKNLHLEFHTIKSSCYSGYRGYNTKVKSDIINYVNLNRGPILLYIENGFCENVKVRSPKTNISENYYYYLYKAEFYLHNPIDRSSFFIFVGPKILKKRYRLNDDHIFMKYNYKNSPFWNFLIGNYLVE